MRLVFPVRERVEPNRLSSTSESLDTFLYRPTPRDDPVDRIDPSDLAVFIELGWIYFKTK